MAPVIALTTDFGIGDAYVGSIKGVILTINPSATITDICHSVEPQNIFQAAFILSTAQHYFPEGTIHLVIVDPEVGSRRKAVILRTPSAFFLAPDNGVLSYIVDELNTAHVAPSQSITTNLERRELDMNIEATAITNPDFWLQPVSPTFHGRDIFAPVAAHLSLGVPPHKFGENINCLHTFRIPRPFKDTEGKLVGHILHIDNFGNLITNIRNSDLPEKEIIIETADQHIHGLSHFYSQSNGLAAIIGSSGYLEIALKNGSAAAFLNMKVHDEVRLRGG